MSHPNVPTRSVPNEFDPPDWARIDESIRSLVDECRASCLWFLRSDYYPGTIDEQVRTLRQIERHGNREIYRRAAGIRQWLSLRSSSRPAGS